MNETELSITTAFKVPSNVTINEITYYFADCDTPLKACAYLQLLKDLQTYDPGVVL